MKLSLLSLVILTLLAVAAQPQLKPLKIAWDPYIVDPGGSNAVIVVYKSTSLGSVFTPFKPTAVVPASRSSATVMILPGLYHLRLTAQVQPFGESDPSNTITNRVDP